MYKWKAYGDYVVSGKLAQIDYFETVFELEEDREAYARAIIQNGLLQDQLKKEIPNFKRWRECHVKLIEKISKTEEASTDPEIEKLLIEATELGCLPPNYHSYKSDAARKRRLKEAVEKKKASIKKRAEKKDGIKIEDKGFVD